MTNQNLCNKCVMVLLQSTRKIKALFFNKKCMKMLKVYVNSFYLILCLINLWNLIKIRIFNADFYRSWGHPMLREVTPHWINEKTKIEISFPRFQNRVGVFLTLCWERLFLMWSYEKGLLMHIHHYFNPDFNIMCCYLVIAYWSTVVWTSRYHGAPCIPCK